MSVWSEVYYTYRNNLSTDRVFYSMKSNIGLVDKKGSCVEVVYSLV